MLAGSLFGWHTKAADPRSYDENGQPKRVKKRDELERYGGGDLENNNE